MYQEQIYNLLMLIVAVLAMALVVGSVRSYWRKLRAGPRMPVAKSAPPGFGRWCGADAEGARVGLWGSRRSFRREPGKTSAQSANARAPSLRCCRPVENASRGPPAAYEL